MAQDTIATPPDSAYGTVAELRSTLLLRAGEILGASLDYSTTLQAVATLAVAGFADACLVDILNEDGTAERLAVDHYDPAFRERMADFIPYPSLAGLDTHVHDAIRTGRAALFRVWDDLAVQRVAQDAGHLELLRAMHPHSRILVPLTARGKVLGLLVLVAVRPERTFDEEDLRLAEELARRAALAVDNARLYARAQSAIEARDQLLSMVSHDLRNPLNVVVMCAALLQEQLPAGETRMRRQLEMIGRSAKHMTRMLEDLLEVAPADARHLSIDPSPVPCAALLVEGTELLGPLARDAGVTLLVDWEGDMPLVQADRSRILQVFSNLGGNALKFTARGGRITVGAVAEGDMVRFSVADTGKGIRPEDLAHIFDRFWQVSRNDRRGIGLGLTIVEGIVVQHGGRVWAESTPGEGSTFYFTLPVAPGAVPGEPAGDTQ